jgi:RNA polymerase sigma-70 factor (ECF subfamily)
MQKPQLRLPTPKKSLQRQAMSQLNDIVLIAQVVTLKSERAFEQLVRRYQSQVRRLFLHLTCGDSQLSDDLAQETFIKVYTGIGSFKNVSNFSTWLYRVAYNVYYDYIRGLKETVDLDAVAAENHYYAEPVNLGSRMDVYAALNRLKEAERTCVTLFYIDDISIEKIADITGFPVGTVKSHLSRGKEKMAEFLKQNGYDGDRR